MSTPRMTPPTACALCGVPIQQKPNRTRGRFRRYCGNRCSKRVRKAAELLARYERRADELRAFLEPVRRTWR
jgi:hypothetical protein